VKWQDAVFTVGSVIFSVALLPMVFGRTKPARSSALSTAAILWAFSLTYLTLALVFAAVSSAVTASLWTVLTVQANR
jgi:hypothetical protein